MSNPISEEKIEQITQANDIVDIIGAHVVLKRTGNNYMGLCPFHNEKTPSFSVSAEKQFYHCFGCGEGGDVVSFMMKYHHLSFIEAVTQLAERGGINLELEKKSQKSKKEYERQYEMNKEAAVYFFQNLQTFEDGMRYLEKRGVGRRVQKFFGIGYSHNQWDGLIKHLKAKGYHEQEMLHNGLVVKKEGSQHYYDRFRNRIMFPIFDLKKRVIGFGGRVMDHTMPKYINSPDSEIFHKGHHLYNLNHAKQEGKNGLILTEGYMDVIKLASHGYMNAVASLGTALTIEQVRLLKRYSKEFFISYDSDQAGMKAALKASNLMKSLGLSARVIILPDKMDPDDYLTQYGKSKYQDKIDKGQEYFDFLDSYFSRLYDLNQDDGKLLYLRQMAENLNYVSNAVEKELYFERIANKLNVSKEAATQELKKSFRKVIQSKPTTLSKMPMGNSKKSTYEDDFIELIRNNPWIIHYIEKKYPQDIFQYMKHKQHIFDIIKDSKASHTQKEGEFKNIKVTIEEICQIVDDYLIKIQVDHLTQVRRQIKQELTNNPEDPQYTEKITNLDREILRLRGQQDE